MSRRLSRGGGITSIASPPPVGNHRGGSSYLNKRIMPNICEICTIGIGTSMQLIDGVWQQFKHLSKEVKKLRFEGKAFKLCDQCYEEVQERKNKRSYLIKKGLIKK